MNGKRTALWGTIAVLVGLGLATAFWPRSLAVDLVAAQNGPLTLTVGDEGETRIVDVFTVSAPITGNLRRIEAEPGDEVVAGATIVAQIEPTDANLLDARTEAEAQAQLSAAQSAEALARAELERTEADYQFAQAELERARDLVANGTISARELEAAERSYKTNRAAIGMAQATLEVRRFELEQAQAQLMSPAEMASQREGCACVFINSPIDGQVLRVQRESAGFVAAGAPLVDIGNAERLEVVVDLLSVDAVKVQAGMRASIDNWGGDAPLAARVRLVEPFGFTKVSALGIEEQRVNVVLDLLSPAELWAGLGHGYQVDVAVVIWEAAETLTVPVTALFRQAGAWAVFVDQDGRAVRRAVEVGHTTATQAQVLTGLSSGERVVVYPGEGVEEGVRIVGRVE